MNMKLHKIISLLAITALLFLPVYAGGGGSGGGSGSGSGSGGNGGYKGIGGIGGLRPDGGGPFAKPYGTAPAGVAQELFNDYYNSNVNLSAGTFQEVLLGSEFTTQVTGAASNRLDVRLPGYTYFQGLIHADNHVTVAGQVRVVGGIVGSEREYATANLYGGAMITTNAHAFTGSGSALKGGPQGMKTRIKRWKEVPSQ